MYYDNLKYKYGKIFKILKEIEVKSFFNVFLFVAVPIDGAGF